MTNNVLKLTDETKNIIMEASALSGIPQNVIKEVWEYFLVNAAIKIADNPDGYVEIGIPYLGKIFVQYVGDSITPTGELSTEVNSLVELNPSFKKLIGDLHDEAQTVLTNLLTSKIEQAVLVASNNIDSVI